MDQTASDFGIDADVPEENEPKLETLKADMEDTRANLAQKLDALQSRLVDTVESTQQTVTDTVTQVQQTIEGAARQMSLSYQTEQRPWLMFGLAVAAGSAVGYMTAPPARRPAPESCEAGAYPPSFAPPFPADVSAGPGGADFPAGSPVHAAAALSPPEVRPSAAAMAEHAGSGRGGMFQEEWDQLKGMAVSLGLSMARDYLARAAPTIGGQIRHLVDSATKKLGGEPIREPLLGPEDRPSATAEPSKPHTSFVG